MVPADSAPGVHAAWAGDQDNDAIWMPPTLVQSGVGVRVLLGTARTLNRSAKTPLSTSALACLASRPDRDAVRRAVDTMDVWRTLDSLASGAALAVVQVMPISFSVDPCAIEARADAAIAARGIEFSTTRSLNGVFQPDSISVAVQGRDVVPSRYGRALVVLPFDSSLFSGSTTVTQYRVYFPTSLLAPGTNARFPAMTVTAYARDGAPQQITIPEQMVRRLWDADLPLRIRRMAQIGAGQAMGQLALPRPGDAALRRGLVQYDAGEFVTALSVVLERLQESSSVDSRGRALDVADRRDGAMLAAASLLALGDTVAARPFLRDALEIAPCLTLDGGASRTAELLNDLRPMARCRFLSPASGLGAMALPGLGHFMTGEAGLGAVVAGVVSAIGIRAFILDAGVRRDYASYQAARSTDGALSAYGDAVRGRDVARSTAMVAVALWLGDGVVKMINERRNSSATESVRRYGSCSSTGDARPTRCDR